MNRTSFVHCWCLFLMCLRDISYVLVQPGMRRPYLEGTHPCHYWSFTQAEHHSLHRPRGRCLWQGAVHFTSFLSMGQCCWSECMSAFKWTKWFISHSYNYEYRHTGILWLSQTPSPFQMQTHRYLQVKYGVRGKGWLAVGIKVFAQGPVGDLPSLWAMGLEPMTFRIQAHSNPLSNN